MYPHLYHKFGKQVFFGQETYIHFVAQKTRIIKKFPGLQSEYKFPKFGVQNNTRRRSNVLAVNFRIFFEKS